MSEFQNINTQNNSEFNALLEGAQSSNDVLKAYLLMDKENADSKVFDKIAFRLIEFGESDKAMSFIEMAETRRSNKELASRIADGLENIFLENDIRDISKNLGSVARAITGTEKQQPA